jgi:hypothetical protein
LAVGFELEIAGLAVALDLEAAAGDLSGVVHRSLGENDRVSARAEVTCGKRLFLFLFNSLQEICNSGQLFWDFLNVMQGL